MRILALLVSGAVAFSLIALSQGKPHACDVLLYQGQPDTTDSDIANLFVDSDLVVDGTVQEVTIIRVPFEQVFPELQPDALAPNIPIAIVQFKVDTVLIGPPQPELIEIRGMYSKSYHNYFEMAEGDRYVLSLHYGGGRGVLAGRYLSRATEERFYIEGSRWFHGRKDRPLAEGDLPELYAAIEKTAAKRSLDALTHGARFIVRGRVVASTLGRCPNGEVDKGIQEVTLAIHSIIKGSVKGDSIVMPLQIKYGKCRLPRGAMVPGMRVGEEWIAFLSYADDQGYYPIAGVNSLFMVKGDSVIRNNSNELFTGYSLQQFEMEVRRIAAQEE